MDHAKSLVEELKAEGWDGKIRLVCPNTVPDAPVAYEAALEAAGMDVDSQVSDTNTHIAAVAVNKDYDLACWGLNISDSAIWRQIGFNFAERQPVEPHRATRTLTSTPRSTSCTPLPTTTPAVPRSLKMSRDLRRGRAGGRRRCGRGGHHDRHNGHGDPADPADDVHLPRRLHRGLTERTLGVTMLRAIAQKLLMLVPVLLIVSFGTFLLLETRTW